MTVSEQTFTEAEHLVARAKSRMVREHPFYASLLFRLEIKPSLEIDTMATDGKSILYNPLWVITLTVAEVAGVLAHEVAHVAYCHHLRRDGRDHKYWNAACDYAINGGLISAGFVLPEGGLYDKAYVGKSSEWIYTQIFPKPEDQPSNSDDGADGDQDQDNEDNPGAGSVSNNGAYVETAPSLGDDSEQGIEGSSPSNSDNTESDEAEQGNPVDDDPLVCPWGEVLDGVDDDGKALDEATKAEEERKVREAVAEAVHREKKINIGSAGKGWLRDVEKSLQASEIPWYQIITEHLIDNRVTDQSYARINRRLLSRGLKLPSDVRTPNGELVLAIDTSCSLTDAELADIEVHVNEIVEVIEPNIVHVVYCDTTVKHSDTFDRGDYVKLKFHGGGGTEFNPPFNWVVHHEIEPDALIYFTDGGGYVGPRHLNDPFEVPSYPVIWATNWQPPRFECEEFGEVVKI